jgi:hypothetical protein
MKIFEFKVDFNGKIEMRRRPNYGVTDLFNDLARIPSNAYNIWDDKELEHLSGTAVYPNNPYGSVNELGWYSFISKIKYKSEWYGKTFVQVDTFYPSSQICSHCSYKNTDVKNLSVRNWICPECNTNHNRDYNASVNILNEGKRLLTI